MREGWCQVCQALTKPPTIVAHLYSQPSAVRPASIFSSGNVLLYVAKVFPVYLYTFLCCNAAIGPWLSTL